MFRAVSLWHDDRPDGGMWSELPVHEAGHQGVLAGTEDNSGLALATSGRDVTEIPSRTRTRLGARDTSTGRYQRQLSQCRGRIRRTNLLAVRVLGRVTASASLAAPPLLLASRKSCALVAAKSGNDLSKAEPPNIAQTLEIGTLISWTALHRSIAPDTSRVVAGGPSLVRVRPLGMQPTNPRAPQSRLPD